MPAWPITSRRAPTHFPLETSKSLLPSLFVGRFSLLATDPFACFSRPLPLPLRLIKVKSLISPVQYRPSPKTTCRETLSGTTISPGIKFPTAPLLPLTRIPQGSKRPLPPYAHVRSCQLQHISLTVRESPSSDPRNYFRHKHSPKTCESARPQSIIYSQAFHLHLDFDPYKSSSSHFQVFTEAFMILREITLSNMGRGAYDTTGVPKPQPPPPKPR